MTVIAYTPVVGDHKLAQVPQTHQTHKAPAAHWAEVCAKRHLSTKLMKDAAWLRSSIGFRMELFGSLRFACFVLGQSNISIQN